MKKITCKHCLNTQYISDRLIEIAHKLLCYVCSNEIKPEDYKDD